MFFILFLKTESIAAFGQTRRSALVLLVVGWSALELAAQGYRKAKGNVAPLGVNSRLEIEAVDALALFLIQDLHRELEFVLSVSVPISSETQCALIFIAIGVLQAHQWVIAVKAIVVDYRPVNVPSL